MQSVAPLERKTEFESEPLGRKVLVKVRGVSDPRNVEIGQRIRMVRQKQGLSQSSVGALLGVSYQQMNKYESGSNSISAVGLRDLSKILQISANWLLGLEQAPEATWPMAFGKNYQRLFIALDAISNRSDQQMLVNLIERIALTQRKSAPQVHAVDEARSANSGSPTNNAMAN
jgi:transcriptional regulator with XRE-family HTH domain